MTKFTKNKTIIKNILIIVIIIIKNNDFVYSIILNFEQTQL